MGDDVRRVILFYGADRGKYRVDDDGTHALIPWSEYDRLRAEMKILGDSNYELCEKIDRLRAEVAEAKASQNGDDEEREKLHEKIADLRAEVEAANDRADHYMRSDACEAAEVMRLQAEVERLKLEHNVEINRLLGVSVCSAHHITDEQIDKAWKFGECFLGPARNNLLKQLSLIGIVKCPECEGVGVGVSEHCTNCAGHGWIREERGDDL
jgi:hypothetical protein